MKNIEIKTAILSVYDKTGIVDFAQKLSNKGIILYSTGGTFKEILNAGIPVIAIEDYLNFPEILSGRVKTLHPKIHGGILARRNNKTDNASLKEHQMTTFDLVCVNLYPFKKFIETVDHNQNNFLEEAIEMIDIGGPTMIRAAAKNHAFVCPVTSPQQYDLIIHELDKHHNKISIDIRQKFAAEAFLTTSEYDNNVQSFLFSQQKQTKEEGNLQSKDISLNKFQDLRYGENPHQQASFYFRKNDNNNYWKVIHGKEMSYNNFLDLDTALMLVKEFQVKEHFCAIFKHTNPCGAAVKLKQIESLNAAIASDPISYFGGVVVFNHALDTETATLIHKNFFEIVIAPSFSEAALSILTEKKNIRIVEYNVKTINHHQENIRNCAGGILIQDLDNINIDKDSLKIVSKIQPNLNDISELEFSWKIAKYVKSNAIVITKNSQTLGIGAGQMSRVDALKIAILKAQEYKHNLKDSYLASDAFFPFRDSIDIATKEGIKGFIQPGGSIKDADSIAAVDEANAMMLFTNIRHFKH